MAATWNLLSKAVGPGLQKPNSNNVKTLQQLLRAAGYDTGADSGTWDDRTTRALLQFRDVHFPGSYPLEVAPDSDDLLILVRLAQIEIALPGATGINGVQRMHDWFVKSGTKYNENPEKLATSLGNRAIYGMQGHTESAIQWINRAWRRGPVEMDCTTYVNLMLGIFCVGNAHQAPYDADCGMFGANSKVHCARDRYNFKEISATFGKETRAYVRTADEMTAVAKENTLYGLEVATSKNSVVHMALLYNGCVMECRPEVKECTPDSDCIKSPIVDFVRRMGGRIFMYEQST